MSAIKNDIIATLAYFDIFNYPITQREIFLFLGNSYDHDRFKAQLNSLVLNRIIFKLDEFYSLQNNHTLVQRRREGNEKASLYKDILNCFLYDAAERIHKNGKDAINGFAEGDEQRMILMGLRRFTKVQPYNSKEGRRRIADHLLAERRYSL